MADEVPLVDAANDATFPPADVDGELNLANDTDFKVDPVSSQVAKEPVKQSKPKEGKNKCARNDPTQAMKTGIIVSGVLLVLAGAAFALTKNMKVK